MICENRLPLSKMRTYIKGGGQILPALTPETGAEYRAKNREIKSRNRFVIFIEKESVKLSNSVNGIIKP